MPILRGSMALAPQPSEHELSHLRFHAGGAFDVAKRERERDQLLGIDRNLGHGLVLCTADVIVSQAVEQAIGLLVLAAVAMLGTIHPPA